MSLVVSHSLCVCLAWFDLVWLGQVSSEGNN